MDKMDKTSLESAIKDEAGRTIADIALKEAQELRRLDDTYTAEVDNFKKRTETDTDTRIRQESSRVENRAGLDLKKLKLKSVEAFISRTVAEASKMIRDNLRYKPFLLGAIVDAARLIPTGAEVRLAGEDLTLANEIRDVLKAADAGSDITFAEDKTIKWGGCIIVDIQGGRIFDSSIERIYFRKSPAIRREVMRLLENSSEGAT